MNTEKKVFLNTGYQMIGKIITASLGFFTFGLLARYLSITQMGEYSLIINFVGFILVFADFGLGTLLTREIANKTANDNYIAETITLRLMLSLVAVAIGCMLILFFPYSQNVKIGVMIYAIANILYEFGSIIWSIFQARLQFNKVVIAQVTTSIVSWMLIILGIILKASFLYLVLATSIGIIAGFFVTMVCLDKKIFLRINKKDWTKIIKEAWPLGAGAIVSITYFKIDSLIVPYFYNPSTHPDLGYYSTAYKFFEVAIVFAGYYTQTLYPVISAKLHEKNFYNQLNKFLIYSIAIAFIVNIGLFIGARPALIILGGKYIPAVASLQILSVAAFASILAGFFLNIAIAGGKQVLILKFSIAAALINILLNIIIIPKYSFIGASWTTVITQCFILATNIYAASIVLREKKDS